MSLVGLLLWLPEKGRDRRRWTAIGVVLISCVSLIASYAAAGATRTGPARTSATPSIAVASPKVKATWASFTTGSYATPRTTADGVQTTDVEIGSGTVARANSVLTVRYIMWLSDGAQVDSSDAAGAPFKFTLGTGMVIRGWDEGVPGMAVGGTRRLVIPPALAYGASGAANSSGAYVVPPNATLVFIIQLQSESPAP